MSRQYSSHTNTSPSKSQILTHFCTNTISHLHKYQLGGEMSNCPTITGINFLWESNENRITVDCKNEMSNVNWRPCLVSSNRCIVSRANSNQSCPISKSESEELVSTWKAGLLSKLWLVRCKTRVGFMILRWSGWNRCWMKCTWFLKSYLKWYWIRVPTLASFPKYSATAITDVRRAQHERVLYLQTV